MTASDEAVLFPQGDRSMIAIRKPLPSLSDTPVWHPAFLAMVPKIRRDAQHAFRKVRPELRQEFIAEVIANALLAYVRLVELGKQDVAFASALGRFAVAQVRVGRRVGSRLRVRDVMSRYAQQRKCFRVESLDHFDDEDNNWQQVVVEDKRATPAEVAAVRIDFASWLGRLPRQRRKIALALAGGETTKTAAKMFGVSPARISQLRLWLKESWQRFQGEIGVTGEQRLAVA
jgi:hypothetical protein